MNQLMTYVAACLTLSLAAGLNAAPLTSGDFLVSDEVLSSNGRIREFTPTGVLVQTLTFTSVGQPRDIAVDVSGYIHIYDGTFTPRLTTLHPTSGAGASHTTISGWSTINGTTYSGLATFGNYVFATDMSTYNGGEENGIIRFDINTLSATRFGGSSPFGIGDYIDLAISADGFLYALYPEITDFGVGQIDVYDPTTLAFQRRIYLHTHLSVIAVDANGDIFAGSTSDDLIHHLDSNGNEIDSAETNLGFTDIDISRAGRILLASKDNVLLTDRNLTTFSTLHVTTNSPYETTFTAWVDTPEGDSMSLLTLGLISAALFRGPRLNREWRFAAWKPVPATPRPLSPDPRQLPNLHAKMQR
jgi:hypothetical protein